jgi:serine protease Do
MVQMVHEQIVKHGRVQRGRLGALIQDLNEDLAKSFDFDSTKGVLVGDVVEGSPAQKAGLKAGDIIVEFNGQPVDNANQLRMAVAATAPGTSSEVTFFRSGKRQTLKIVTDELTDESSSLGSRGEGGQEAPDESAADLGLSVQSLTPELAEQLGYERDQGGVVITDVEPASAGARAGLRAKDVIVDVDGKAIRGVREFRAAMDKADLAKGIRLQVMRDGARRFVFLRNSAG